LHRVSATSNNCLCVLPSKGTQKKQKVVVGDTRGELVCFKMESKGKSKIVFQKRRDKDIACVVLNNDWLTGGTETIHVAYGQTVEFFSKKGGESNSSVFNISLNEDIKVIWVEEHQVFTAGEYFFNSFVDHVDTHVYMACDHILDFCIIYFSLPHQQEKMQYAVLGCRDKYIRILQCGELFFEQPVCSAVTVVREFPVKSDDATPKQQATIIYGTKDGTVGVVDLIGTHTTKRFEIPSNSKSGAVNVIKVGQVTGDAKPEICVGRDNGVLDIYELTDSGSVLIASEKLTESITGLDLGFVTGLCSCDIVVSTYSGRIVAFQFHDDVRIKGGDLKTFGKAEYTYTSKQANLSNEWNKNDISSVKKKIETLERANCYLQMDIQHAQKKYQTQSQELIAAKPSFKLKHSFELLVEEACYELVIEINMPISCIVFKCSVQVLLLDSESSDENSAIISETPTKDGSLLATARMPDQATRFSIKLRTTEGAEGKLFAMVISQGYPRASQMCSVDLKALSLHTKVHQDEKNDKDVPFSTLDVKGDFSTKDMNSWLTQSIPDVPPRVGNSDTISMFWRCTFTGTCLRAVYRKGEALFKSDNLSSLSILKEVISRIATANKVGLRVSISVNAGTCPHYLSLIRPKFDYYRELRRRKSLINAIKEIQMAESDDLDFLDAEYKEILDNAPKIVEEYEKSKHLEFLKTLVRHQLHCYISTGSQARDGRLRGADLDQLLEDFNWDKIEELFHI